MKSELEKALENAENSPKNFRDLDIDDLSKEQKLIVNTYFKGEYEYLTKLLLLNGCSDEQTRDIAANIIWKHMALSGVPDWYIKAFLSGVYAVFHKDDKS